MTGGEKTDLPRPPGRDRQEGASHPSIASSLRLDRGSNQLRLVLISTRFVAVSFWLTVAFGALLFVLPRYRETPGNPMFLIFVTLSIIIFLANYFFPFEGYHPILFIMLMTATDSLIAVLVYLTGGSSSNFFLLYPSVLLFSVAYLELPESIAVAVLTSAFYFAPVAYEAELGFERLKSMMFTVPIFLLFTVCGELIVRKAREEALERGLVAELLKEADLKQQELSTLYASSLKLASIFDHVDVGETLVGFTTELLKAEKVFLALTEEGGGEILSLSGIGEREANELLQPSPGNPIRMAEVAVLPVVLDARDNDPRFQGFFAEHADIGSLLSVPLFASSRVIGILCCISSDQGAFNDESARLLLTLASQAALAIEKSMLYNTALEDKVKIEAIINTMNDGIMVIDESRRLTLANPAVQQLFNIGPEDFGKPLTGIFDRLAYRWRLKEHALEDVLEQVASRSLSVRDELVVEIDEPLHFQIFAIPLLGREGVSVGSVLLLHDITDLVRLDRLKSDFISIVSHELKTPLTSIRGFVRLLAAQRVGTMNEKQMHYLDIVEKQTESLASLINDLLDLSKIESGVIEVHPEPLSLHQLLEEVVLSMRGQAAEKRIEVVSTVPEGLPPVMGDRERLRQVFLNLLDNAIKFTESGGRVTISASTMDGECLVKLQDNGIGIPPSDLDRIFDKFYQVESSMTRQRGGSGLGLAITRQLVRAHGGEIWARSQLGEGTTFFIRLNLASDAAAERGLPGAADVSGR